MMYITVNPAFFGGAALFFSGDFQALFTQQYRCLLYITLSLFQSLPAMRDARAGHIP
jgi:hypothetical protein